MGFSNETIAIIILAVIAIPLWLTYQYFINFFAEKISKWWDYRVLHSSSTGPDLNLTEVQKIQKEAIEKQLQENFNSQAPPEQFIEKPKEAEKIKLFSSIRESWGKAEGDVLKSEFLTAAENLEAGHGNPGWARKVLANLHDDIKSEHGDFDSISEATKKKLSKELLEHSRKMFQESSAENDRLGIGQAYALLMYGTWLKASVTPGESAEFVVESMRDIVNDCVKRARLAKNNYKK